MTNPSQEKTLRDEFAMAVKPGDIYRWRWKPEHPRHKQCEGTGTLYWCMSRIAIADSNGRLFDIYWTSDRHRVNPEEVELEFIANTDSIQRIPEYEADYYADEDIVNLNHANSSAGNLYIRNGAKRNKKKIENVLMGRIEKLGSDIRFAEYKITECRKMLALVDAGNLAEVYL